MRSKKYVFRAGILSFLHRAAEMSFYHEIFHVYKKYVYIHHQKNSEFFEIFTIFPKKFIEPQAGELASQNG